MNNSKIAEMCFEHNARFGTIVHLGAILVDDSYVPDALDSFIENHVWFEGNKNLFPKENPFIADEDFDPREVIDWLIDNRFFGFLVCVETPKLHPEQISFYPDGRFLSATYGWGWTKIKWFYGEDFLSLVKQGMEWAEKYEESVIEEARRIAGFGSEEGGENE